MAIDVRVESFAGAYATKNTPRSRLPVGVADVVRAAVTVGGPVSGSAWHRSLRHTAVAGTVLSAIGGAMRRQPLTTTGLYEELETTEKSGVSFRLGMAFATIAAERVLAVRFLEHLTPANSIVARGSRRRADLFGLDGEAQCHVLEAKSRTYGPTREDIEDAKRQARSVEVVERAGTKLLPATRSACVTDLSVTPIHVRLVDPPEGPIAKARYRIDVERLIEAHFSLVPALLEVQGNPQPPPYGSRRDVVGAYLPETDIWLGVDAALFGRSKQSWRQRLEGRDDRAPNEMDDIDTESVGRDGHVLQLGRDLDR